ncbi:MAG: hypothetical protein AAF193_09460, partial [Bacteroidota bacterium]
MKFNRILAAVVGKFYDKVTGKLYLPLIKSLAEGVLSPGVRNGNTINDVSEELKGKADPPNGAILCASLARAIRNAVVLGEDTSTGPADGSRIGGSVNVVGVTEMSQLSESVKADMRACIPNMVTALRYLVHDIRFFQKWIDDSKQKVDVTAGIAAGALPAKDGLYGSFVAVAASDGDNARVYLSNLLNNLAPAAEGLLKSLSDAYRSLADVPMYFETYKGFTREQKRIAPLGLVLSGISDDQSYWFTAAVGTPAHKFNHAIRGIMLPNSALNMQQAPSLSELFKSYNSSVNATFSFSEADLRDYSAANLLAARFLADFHASKPYICDSEFDAAGFDSWCTRDQLDNLNKVVALFESSKRDRILKLVTKDAMTDQTGLRRENFDERKKIISYNLLEIGSPLDVLALSKSVPFTHLINAAWTY